MVDKRRRSVEGVRVAIGRALKAMRGRDSQDVIAELIGVTQVTVSRWEHGKSSPTLDQMVVIEDHYGRPRGSLLRDAGLIEPVDTLEKVVAADPRLSAQWRIIVLDAYERAVEFSASDSRRAAASKATRRS